VVQNSGRPEALLEAQSGFAQNPAVAQALAAYSSGDMDLQSAISKAKGGYSSGIDNVPEMPDFASQLQGIPEVVRGKAIQQAEDKWRAQNQPRYQNVGDVGFNDTLFRQLASTTPGGASRFAEGQMAQELSNSPGLNGMFGEGGSFAKAQDEEARLRDQGFQLTPEDREAYGQVSGDITRQFGQQGQNLSQMLAERGLSGAPSGAAGSGFSGLAGNKFEQLAKAQTNIAQQRMQTTMQRLNSNRSYMNSLMNSEMEMRESARNRIFNQSMQGRQQGMQETQIGANQQLAARGMEQNQLNTGFEQQQATKSPGIGSALGGLVGAGVGSLAGGLGTGIGASVGKNLFGGDS